MGNQNGQSLIQVLISIGITGILMVAMTTMIGNQNTEIRALKEKLAEGDFQQQLIRSFSDGSVCTNLVTLPSALTFNSTNAVIGSSDQPVINLTRTSIPLNLMPSAPVLAAAGQLVSPISNSLMAAPTQTFQIAEIVGFSNGSTGVYSATFRVNFDQTKLVRAIRPASTLISLQTTGTGAMQTITACAQFTSSQQKSIALGTLATFLPTVALTASGWDGTCYSVLGSSSLSFKFNSACSRYCTNGCGSGNCPTPQPGLGFGTGSMSECNDIVNAAICSCVP